MSCFTFYFVKYNEVLLALGRVDTARLERSHLKIQKKKRNDVKCCQLRHIVQRFAYRLPTFYTISFAAAITHFLSLSLTGFP
jgi:hypothetical protein